MRLEEVESSAVAKVGYDRRRRILRIRYRGQSRVYDYFDVPSHVAEELEHAPSIGEYVNVEIKPHYRYEEVVAGT